MGFDFARSATAALPAEPMLPAVYRVEKRVKDTGDTFTLTLAPAGESGEFSFAPGQFNMLTAFGVGEVPISISGDPGRPLPLVHTVRAVGAVTRAICGLRKGDEIGVRGPFGTPWPMQQAEGNDIVIIAGGLGLAPLRPAVYHVLNNRVAYGNVEIVYGSRTPYDLLYRNELHGWRGRFDTRVRVTVDTGTPDWRGAVGVVTTIIPRISFDPWHTTALVCGPGMMMRFVVQELLKRKVPEENIFLSMERSMKCGIGFCGHCQLGPVFICKEGPVFSYARLKDWFEKREI
jgi:NAD(P)H-flavin reductase